MSIPITRPVFGEEEKLAVQKPLESGWVVQGPYVAEFEHKFGDFVGSPYSVASSNCTTALHLAVAALGLSPGDEVIVPAFTWVATANVVEYMGATPVFCDIDLTTYNIDVAAAEACVSDRTVGILPVHLFGLCADMDPLMDLADRRGLWVVEDAACAFGGWYHGRHAGTFGEAGCFSFHPRKSITTGEGGMVTTANAEFADRIRSLRDHGASRSDLNRHEAPAAYLLADYDVLGYNYRMTDIQGAIGSVQMDRAEWILDQRARCAETYDAALADFEWLALPVTPDGLKHGFQSYVCLFQPEPPNMRNVEALNRRRNALMETLESQGIATRQGTHAPVVQRFYAEKYALTPEQFPNAYLADRLSLALPLFAQMTDLELEMVVSALRNAIDG